MVNYFGRETYQDLFDVIYNHYSQREATPDYLTDVGGLGGIDALDGPIQAIHSDEFYPTVFSKAVHLLLSINQGHYFSNGNKRVALVFTIAFLLFNEYRFGPISREQYDAKLHELFPEFIGKFEDHESFTPLSSNQYLPTTSIGVCIPIPMWGRSVLYQCRNSGIALDQELKLLGTRAKHSR